MLIWLDFRSGRAVRISVNVIGRLVNSKTSRTFVAALDIKNPHVLDEGYVIRLVISVKRLAQRLLCF
jgi:hypothetical protein